MAKARIVHFINHFFAGVGGEEKADTPVAVKDGPLGPGQGLQKLLGDKASIVATVYCGDSYYPEHLEDAREQALSMIKDKKADLVVAGPAFAAGRYGQACADLLQAAAESLNIPGVMGVSPDNAGLLFYKAFKNRKVYAVPTAESAVGMTDALSRMATLAMRLADGEAIGPAKPEGYIPRGIRVNAHAQAPGVDRAVGMLIARLTGQPFQTEVPVVVPDLVEPAPAIPDLTKAKIALATTAGIQPWGNPLKMPSHQSDRFAKHNIEGLSTLEKGKWQMIHSISTHFADANPNIMAPLDALRQLEDAGQIGSLHSHLYSWPAVGGQISVSKRLGQEMARDMKASGVNGVVMVST